MISSTQEALTALSVTNDVLTEEQKTRLEKDGYCLISITPQEWKDRGIDLDQISRVVNELITKEGWKGGWDHIKEKMIEGQHPESGTQRLNNLLSKHPCFRKVFTIPEALACAKLLIQDEICLSQLILRMPLPGMGEQPWHIDWTPRKHQNDPVRSALTSLFLDDFTKENGTTRVVPGTHKLLGDPNDYGYNNEKSHPNEKYMEAPRGSLLMYNINLWHAGTVCKNGKPRRHLNINYRDRKIWQQINFKKDLPTEIIEQLSEAERYLLKIRDEDPNRNEWLFRNRNNWLVKRMTQAYWKFLDSRDKKKYLNLNIL